MWSYYGTKQTNAAASVVDEYVSYQLLSKIGFRFDPSRLSQEQVQAYKVIASKLHKIEEFEAKKARNKARKR